jgi:hypothetical protein
MSLLRNTLQLGILLLLFGCSPIVWAAEPGESKPIAVVETPDKQFQDIMRGDLISESFVIKNAGDLALNIEGIEMSHTGMKIRVKSKVEPGASVEAIIEWDTQGFAGEVEGNATVLTNDPLQPRLNLTLKGRIIPPIEVLPRPAFYLSQFQGEHSATEFTIRNNQEKRIKILRLEPLGEHFEASIEALEEGKLWSLIVKIPAATPPGRFREALKIHTDDEQNPAIHVEVNVLVKPDIFISPDAVDFGRISQARIKSNPQVLEFLAQTIVVNRREGAMSINAKKSDIPFIQVEQEPEGRSTAFALDVKLDPALLQHGPFEGQIIISTDDPEFPELKIPVTGEVTD